MLQSDKSSDSGWRIFQFYAPFYSKNSYLCVFESKDGALEKFGNDKVYEFVKEKTLNLLDKQSFASSILTMMNDFPHDKDLNNDRIVRICNFIKCLH